MSMSQENSPTQGSRFLHVIYVVLFLVLLHFMGFIVIALALLQLVISVFSGKPNEALTGIFGTLGDYLRQLIRYVGFVGDDKPFPLGEWPRSSATQTPPESN